MTHLSKFTIHPGSTKMYRDLRENFWWSNMKGEIAEYVSGCDTCQRIKASHLKTAVQMQPLSIPAWKWDDISMDFIVGLSLTPRKHDSIWVIVDRLTKTAHFIPVHTNYSARYYTEIYVDLIVACTAFRKLSFQTEALNLLLAFGHKFMNLWVPS
jgi:hypothetical protein